MVHLQAAQPALLGPAGLFLRVLAPGPALGRSFQKARRALAKLPQYELEDVRYRRSRYPAQPEELRRWLDLKNLCVLAGSTDMDLLFSPALPQWLGEELAALKPFYDFCLRAESRREHPGNAD